MSQDVLEETDGLSVDLEHVQMVLEEISGFLEGLSFLYEALRLLETVSMKHQ